MPKPLNRRAFLKKSAAVGATVGMFPGSPGPFFARIAHAAWTGHAQQFWAYSLQAAERQLKAGRGAAQPLLQSLGQITKMKGLLVDPATADCILVGERDSSLPPLQLDDLVVMLRGVFAYEDGEAPGVSVDPSESDPRHSPQRVQYFGHVERTHVGRVCFDADYEVMKKIGLGLRHPGVEGVQSYFDLACEEAARLGGGKTEVLTRFWFYPVVSRVVTVGNGVLLDRCELAVVPQVLSATVGGRVVQNTADFCHQPSERFAASFSEHFDELAEVWQAVRELRSLNALSALAQGLKRTDTRPKLEYWLTAYPVAAADTPETAPVLSRASWAHRFEVYGGVVLEALSIRLKQGDLTGFSTAILQARPSPDELVWSLYLTPELDLIIPPVPGQVDAAQAYVRGQHFFHARQYDHAIACWLQVARTYPDMGEAYCRVGRAFERKRMPAAAAHYYSKALQADPFLANLKLWNRSGADVPAKERVP